MSALSNDDVVEYAVNESLGGCVPSNPFDTNFEREEEAMRRLVALAIATEKAGDDAYWILFSIDSNGEERLIRYMELADVEKEVFLNLPQGHPARGGEFKDPSMREIRRQAFRETFPHLFSSENHSASETTSNAKRCADAG